MQVKNAQLLNSQKALQELTQASLKGTHALALKEIMSAVEERLQHLQEVQQSLVERAQAKNEDLTEEEADEEWTEVLEDDLELDHDPLPQEAVENIEISAAHLMALDWLIED